MKKLFVLSSIALFTFAILTVQESQARGKDPEMGKGPHKGVHYQELLKHADELNLDNNQQADIEKIGMNAEKEMIQLKADREILSLDLGKEMHAEQSDRKAVISLIEKINDIEGQIKKNRLLLMLDIKKVLTKEQLDKIEKVRETRRADRMERRMERRNDRGKRPHGDFTENRPE